MARAPAAAATPPPDPGAAGMMGGDMGAGPEPDADSDDNVVCTVCDNGDGTYTVFAGDEPEGGGAGDDTGSGDMSEDDDDAMAGGDQPAGGGNGGAPGAEAAEPQPQGQQADSIGAALKLVMDLLKEHESSAGASGSANDQFAAGYSADQSPTPASGPQKY